MTTVETVTRTKAAILAAIRSGEPRHSIAFRMNVPVAKVSEIHTAAKAVREFQRRGVSPTVLYANFSDLLTKQECGL